MKMADLDPEVQPLCAAMNRLPGIETTESCCGHRLGDFIIWFRVTDYTARGFLTLARATCPRYYGYAVQPHVVLWHGDRLEDQVSYMLVIDNDRGAYRTANALARILDDHTHDRVKGYNILRGKSHARGRPRRGAP